MKLLVAALVAVVLAAVVVLVAPLWSSEASCRACATASASHGPSEGRTGDAAPTPSDARLQAVVPASTAGVGHWPILDVCTAVTAVVTAAACSSRPALSSRPHDPSHLHACPLLI